MENSTPTTISYRTSGTCSRQIIFTVTGDVLTDVRFINGCNGNAQGISKLITGRPIDEIIEKLSGIKCRNNTSCPDQLAAALTEFKKEALAKKSV